MGKAPPSLKNARILVSDDGAISVTPLDLTDEKRVGALKKAFA
jgi:hypothetical protein